MVDRVVRWVVIVAAILVFWWLKLRIGLLAAAIVGVGVLLLLPTVLIRLGAKNGRSRPPERDTRPR